jgi:hypothetical protein
MTKEADIAWALLGGLLSVGAVADLKGALEGGRELGMAKAELDVERRLEKSSEGSQ